MLQRFSTIHSPFGEPDVTLPAMGYYKHTSPMRLKCPQSLTPSAGLKARWLLDVTRSTPGIPNGFPRISDGSAFATSLSGPAQDSLALRPMGLLAYPQSPHCPEASVTWIAPCNPSAGYGVESTITPADLSSAGPLHLSWRTEKFELVDCRFIQCHAFSTFFGPCICCIFVLTVVSDSQRSWTSGCQQRVAILNNNK